MKKQLCFAALTLVFNLAYANVAVTTQPSAQIRKPIISEYWCGPDDGCGQSTSFSDLNPAVTDVFVAFALTDASGKASFNLSAGYNKTKFINDVAQLKQEGKKVILSVGGQGADWGGALANPQTFSSSIFSLIQTYGFDGVDLDIESTSLATAVQSQQLIKLISTLRTQFGKQLLITITPESTGVVKTVGIIGGAWNTMVPVINQAINQISFIQVQAYNDNPLGDQAGTAKYLEDIYNDWIQPFKFGAVNYNGMPANKLVLGVPASTSAANASYYVNPANLAKAIRFLKQTYGSNFAGAMTWDSHWDQLNGNLITNTFVNSIIGE